MNIKATHFFGILLGLVFLFSTSAMAATVEVNWKNPDKFTDVEASYVSPGDEFIELYFARLERHFQRLATMHLPTDYTLEIEVTDIDRAGRVEARPGAERDRARVVMGNEVPEMVLSYRLLNSAGEVVSSAPEATIKGSVIRTEGRSRFPILNRNDRGAIGPEARMINLWFLATFIDPEASDEE
ncbi:DUF3016 domain-containing protein [Aliidiomarina indica]|uniref:DUF3016 domain-containing protein n=1 Tax=Aliidiomarina indica TaxID=2749147 RepID=UPI00188EAC81|nr:DUF3016 domain-containing protein [Aliidiomarina indica]